MPSQVLDHSCGSILLILNEHVADVIQNLTSIVERQVWVIYLSNQFVGLVRADFVDGSKLQRWRGEVLRYYEAVWRAKQSQRALKGRQEHF